MTKVKGFLLRYPKVFQFFFGAFGWKHHLRLLGSKLYWRPVRAYNWVRWTLVVNPYLTIYHWNHRKGINGKSPLGNLPYPKRLV